MNGRSFEGVFFLVIKKSLGQFDFIHGAHSQDFIAQHGTAHFKTGNGFLQQDFTVVPERFCHSGIQIGGQAYPGDPEGRTSPHRLDKQRKPQRLRRGCNLFPGGTAMENGAFRDIHSGQSSQFVGPVFVHAQGAGQQATADHRNTCQRKDALHGAILPVFAVENGEGGIESLPAAGTVQPKQGTIATVQRQGAGNTVLLVPMVRGQGGHRPLVAQPAPFPGDAYCQHLEPGRIYLLQNGGSRLQRHRVFGGASAEQHQNPLSIFIAHTKSPSPSYLFQYGQSI